MDAATLEKLKTDPKIDKAASILIELLHQAVTEERYGTFGVALAIKNGQIVSTKAVSEETHN